MEAVLNNSPQTRRGGVAAPLLLVAMLAMMVLPMPTIALDMFFTLNIGISLVVLLVCIYAARPLDFVVFPTVLLITTLMRLSVNVASTRVVLLEGHTGTGAAGNVIEAFGEFVIGGNYAVGLVVFAILVIINFVVVTKGAGRVSEVSARFTLDAMPGKQMAIDADLNAGLIDQETARARREDVSAEADFYGSMDGASKFVKGDAIAGILILFINVIGGLAIGIVQHDLAAADAVQFYTLLTIGDGLVAQIPSLLLSSATAIIITRNSKARDLGQQVFSQLFENTKPLWVTAAIMGLLGIIPGMPNMAFLFLALVMALSAYYFDHRVAVDETLTGDVLPAQAANTQAAPQSAEENKELSWDDVKQVDLIGLEVGYGLIPLVDRNQDGMLLNRIKGVRKKLSQEFGFLIQAVHIRDNLDLNPNAYRITLLGVPLGESEIYPDREMAINPGTVYGELQGIKGTDPAFGLEAVWIDSNQRDHAQTLGYTVVDAATVVATHLSQLLQEHSYDLIGYEEVQQMLDKLEQSSPKLVEDLVPKTLSLGTIVKVLQSLLKESVPIRDMRSIAETLADNGARSQDPDVLTAYVRVALGRSIIQNIIGVAPEMPVITLDPSLEQLLLESVQSASNGALGIEPNMADKLFKSLEQATQQQEIKGEASILVVAPPIRAYLSKLVRHSIRGLHVMAYNEIPDNKQIKVVATVGGATDALETN
ncbi:MAG: flagellar biosynthesis protein FlhA [Gammaproteobacteria bacterium]|nr:flagellar biosynthesis protein FlhA [Gammaproteobacteria bacterium]